MNTQQNKKNFDFLAGSTRAPVANSPVHLIESFEAVSRGVESGTIAVAGSSSEMSFQRPVEVGENVFKRTHRTISFHGLPHIATAFILFRVAKSLTEWYGQDTLRGDKGRQRPHIVLVCREPARSVRGREPSADLLFFQVIVFWKSWETEEVYDVTAT